MNKKVLMSLVLLAIIGTSAVFAQQPTLDKLQMQSIKNGAEYQAGMLNLKISGEVVIPATYNGKPVTAATTFPGCSEITSITYPAGVTIGGGNSNLVKVTSITFQGSDITGNLFNFPGDLQAKYQAGGAGTYTRPEGGKTWTKQGGSFSLNGVWTRADGMKITITDNGANIVITGDKPNNGGKLNDTYAKR
jgi:hypothetical protein